MREAERGGDVGVARVTGRPEAVVLAALDLTAALAVPLLALAPGDPQASLEEVSRTRTATIDAISVGVGSTSRSSPSLPCRCSSAKDF